MKRHVAFVLLVALTACGGSSGGGGAPAALATDTIGPAGGSLATADGTAVVVSAGAVSQPTTFSISAGGDIAPNGFDAIGPARTLGPTGRTFTPPVLVTLPSTLPNGIDREDVLVAHRNDRTGDVTLLRPRDVTTGGDTTVELSSFSTVQVVHSRATPPTVTSVDPDTGDLAGGTTVTVRGQDFRGGSPTLEVFFDDEPATSVTRVSQTEVRAVTPAGLQAGPVDVRVRNADGPSGVLTDGFTYDDGAPATTATPAGGLFTGSVSVTLSTSEPATTYFTTDGSSPTTASPVYTASLTFTADTTLRFFSVDTSGDVETVQQELYEANLAPVASLSVDRTSDRPGKPFLFDASSSSDAHDPTNALMVRWDWEDDGTWDTAYLSSKTHTHAYTRGGSKTVRLEVLDTGGLTHQATTRVAVAQEAGDLNGDGIVDLAVGAQDVGNGGPGQVFVFFGSPTLSDVDLSSGGAADLVFRGEVAGDWFGFSVAAGDVNGDGHADLITGAPLHDSGGTEAGRVYVFFGGPGLTSQDLSAGGAADLVFTGNVQHDALGRAVTTGDLNDDGVRDLILGANFNINSGPFTEGRVWVFFGGATLTSQDLSAGGAADLTFRGARSLDRFGKSVASADVNGDAIDDLVVGADQADIGMDSPGGVWIFFGGATLASQDLTASGTADVVLIGAAHQDQAAYDVKVGDINGDQVADVVFGSYFNDDGGNNSGQGYVFYGGPTLTSRSLLAGQAADVTFTGESADDQFGNHVVLLDVDDDGLRDVVFGAPTQDAAGAAAGRVYVFRGGPGLSGIDLSQGGNADFTFTAEGANQRFSQLGGGDYDGDGAVDLAVGAPFHDSETGRVFVFFGGTGFTSQDLSSAGSADVTLTGPATGSRFSTITHD